MRLSSPSSPSSVFARASPVIMSLPADPITFSMLTTVSSVPPSTVTVAFVPPFNVSVTKLIPSSVE